MSKRAALFLTALFFCATALSAAPLPKKKRPVKPVLKAKEEIVKPEAKTKEDILKAVEQSTAPVQEGMLSRILTNITFDTKYGPVIPFPVVDSSKDLGPSFGFMPVIAIKDQETKNIKSVIVPSVMYNGKLGTTLTYRHYIFPDEKRYFILRASLSQHIEHELEAYYYTPQFLSTNFRFSWEAKDWTTGKPSFYGIGINSKLRDKANYSLRTTGEELILDIPVIKNLFLNIDHSYYVKQIGEGPASNSPGVKQRFPASYPLAADEHRFHTNRFSIVYDDTDHPFLPKIGTYASASVLYSNKALDSDFEYRTYSLQLKNYYNYKEQGRYVTAVHYLLQFQRGDELPFYAMPQLGESTGLRMAGDGRFTDRGKFVFTIEERITLSKTPFYKFISETEIAPFLDVGTVFPKVSDFRGSKLKYSPGISARLVIRPQLVATLEFAYGSEGSNAIIRIGYPF